MVDEWKKRLAAVTASLGASIAALAIVLSVWLSPTSYGWFSSNTETPATGMSVGVEAPSNLVIRATSTDEWGSAIDLTEKITRMYPATAGGAGDSGLKYVTNPSVLSLHTGLAKNGKTLSYDDIENDTFDEDGDGTPDHIYYLDFSFQLAMQGKPTESTLSVTLPDALMIEEDETDGTETLNTTDAVADSHKAATVWVFVNDVSKGQINLANGETPLSIYEGTIPSESETPLSVLLRVYFDGELKKNATTAYINSETVDLRGLSLNVCLSMPDN